MFLISPCSLPIHSDWYATFCGIVGVDPTDKVAAEAGLPAIDSMNMWPLISGQVKVSPRTQVMISDHTFISGHYKLMTGLYQYAAWQVGWWYLVKIQII